MFDEFVSVVNRTNSEKQQESRSWMSQSLVQPGRSIW